jgi:hypothetical protein
MPCAFVKELSRSETLPRRLTAQFIGTALLVVAVVGSGIMGDRLAGGNVAIALLANTIATGAALVALILTFRPVSGAHFNPAVSIADATHPWPPSPAAAHSMKREPHPRDSAPSSQSFCAGAQRLDARSRCA